jgi:hypothetical protein
MRKRASVPDRAASLPTKLNERQDDVDQTAHHHQQGESCPDM